MTDTHDLLGPELEGLLREAAADPRSRLLRVPRPARVDGLWERQEVLRPSATDLTALDRHLLTAHRAELASLLLRTCRLRVLGDDQIVERTYLRAADRTRVTPDKVRAVGRDAASLAELALADPLESEGLQRVLSFARSSAPRIGGSLSALAWLANRLDPSVSAKAWMAFDHAIQGHNQLAIRAITGILSCSPPQELASVSLENLGMAHSNLGRFDLAASAYRRAHERDPRRSTAAVGWMHMAILAEDPRESSRALREVDEGVEESDVVVRELIQGYSRRIRAGRFAESRVVRELARGLAHQAGSISGRVVDVYV